MKNWNWLDPYVRFEPNLHNYKVKLILVKPSAYGDNLDDDKFLEELQ